MGVSANLLTGYPKTSFTKAVANSL